MDAFDADVLIYAAVPDHPLGRRVRVLFPSAPTRPVDEATAHLAVALGSAHGLRAADAVHLATAVAAGAGRFITNDASEFSKAIPEIDVVYPDELPDP